MADGRTAPLRRADLAEILGPALLDSDRESRSLRLRRIAEDAYVTLPAADRAAFAAYTRGVNQFIATHLQQSAGGVHAAQLPAAARGAWWIAC